MDLETGVIEHQVNFEANLSDEEEASWDEEEAEPEIPQAAKEEYYKEDAQQCRADSIQAD